MGSIPLPALQVRTPEQPDVLNSVAKLYQLQNLKREADLAPLRKQAMEQQVQGGALDLQQKQIQLKDKQAMNAAFQEWGKPKTPSVTTNTGAITNPETGEVIGAGKPVTVVGPPGAGMQTASANSMPDYDELINLAKKHGVSFDGIKGLQSSILEMRDKASTIAKNDAQTGQANASAMKTKNGMIIDAMSGALGLPDDQLAQGIMTAAQELGAKGLLDPQHLQMAQQLANSGNPALMRLQLELQIKGMGGFNKILEDAQKKAQVMQDQGKSDPTSIFYAPSASAVAMGTAPGAAQIKQGEVTQAAAKAGAEAKARQPYELALARQRQALSQGDPEAAGQLLVNGDATLSELKSRGATPDFIAKALFAARKLSGGKYNAQEAEANFKVAQSPAQVAFFGSAKSLTDQGGTLDQLAETAKKIPQHQLPIFNSLDDWTREAAGSGPLAEYASRVLGVADDYSKVMGGGQGSDTSRLQAANLISKKLSEKGREGAIAGIRGSVNSQITSRIGNNSILKRMYGDTGQGGNQQQPGSGNDAFSQFGGKAH